jgi:hypothetical protein
MNENREDPAASIKREIHGLAELTSPDLINALSEAAEEDDLWLEATRDVRRFLHEKGIALPDWAEIRLEGIFPDTRVMNQDLPKCDQREVVVARPGRAYCARRVYFCKRAPHIGEVCISYCVKWEREWLDAVCVQPEDFRTAHFSIRELGLPPIYEGPPDS